MCKFSRENNDTSVASTTRELGKVQELLEEDIILMNGAKMERLTAYEKVGVSEISPSYGIFYGVFVVFLMVFINIFKPLGFVSHPESISLCLTKLLRRTLHNSSTSDTSSK